MNTINKSIGSNIKKSRALLGLAQNKLAKEVGIGRSHMCQIEGGKRKASVELLMGISYCLGVSVQDLLEGTINNLIENVTQKSNKAALKQQGDVKL